MTYDVIVAGAGPVGLLLACELGMVGVRVLVLEREAMAVSPWKTEGLGTRGLNTPSVEAFHRRGLLDAVLGPDDRPTHLEKTATFQFAGHFAGIPLDGNQLEPSRWKYRLPGPSLLPGPTSIERIETVLSERAARFGVTLVRGAGVTGVEPDDDGVTVHAGEKRFRAGWLVGCDGGRSTVRKAAGFEFVGTEAAFTGYAALCDLDGSLEPGMHLLRTGTYMLPEPGRLYVMDFDGGAFDRSQPITRGHLERVLRRVSGTDATVKALHLVSSFTDRSKQATSYRRGRVLLAGDAAHIHSPLGAQGLNTGLGDAMNLGWKLAATVKGSAAPGLIDTYTDERHPIGAAALEFTRVQVSTMQPTLHGEAMVKLVRDLIATTDGANHFIDRFWGLSQRYDLGDAHPLVGRSAPDLEFVDGSRLGSRMTSGRWVLVDPGRHATLADVGPVDVVGDAVKDALGLAAFLVRPDGVVAWATDDAPDAAAARNALSRWVQ